MQPPPTAAGVQIRRKASGIPVPVPQGTVWALLAGGSVMSARGWEGARKSKILQMAQKGRKEAGGQAQPQARAAPRSGHGRAQGAPRHPQLTQPQIRTRLRQSQEQDLSSHRETLRGAGWGADEPGKLISESPGHATPRSMGAEQDGTRRRLC